MSLLTAADVKRAAGVATTTADEDVTIAEMIDAIDVVVERPVGAGRMPTTVKTWTGRCRSGSIVLPWSFASVSSVTVDGVALDASTFDDETRAHMGILDGVNGVVPWSSGTKVVVVATVGQASIAADIKRAAMVLVRHWWQLDRQGGRGAWADENGAPLDAAIPKQVRDLLNAPGGLAGVG